jgi:hypothetical protein
MIHCFPKGKERTVILQHDCIATDEQSGETITFTQGTTLIQISEGPDVFVREPHSQKNWTVPRKAFDTPAPSAVVQIAV